MVFSLLLRWGSFFISVINHDESTYIVIADEMLRGEVYLQDVVDTKPIGIFLIYAALIKLTGGSLILLRAAAALVVALGAWGLFLATRRALGSYHAGVAAGLIYCICNSVFTYYGISPNTEIFFNLFTIAAIALSVAPRIRKEKHEDPFWQWPVAGLLLGLAVSIKPFAAAEALAIGLFLVYYYLSTKQFGRMITTGLSLVAGFAIPLLAIFFYYRQQGMLDTLLFYLFEVNGAYPVELAWYLRLKYMGDYLLRYSPFVILGALTLVQVAGTKYGERWTWTRFLLLQFALVTVVVLLTGKRFGHYQIQLHPPLAALAGVWWVFGETAIKQWKVRWTKTYTPALLLLLALSLSVSQYSHYQRKDDKAARIAEYLEPRLQPGETFFGLNGWQITYHLLGRDVPTPYVHSSLLFYDHHVRAFQINEKEEAESLLKNDKLVYLFGRVKDESAQTILTETLMTAFSPVDTLPGEIVIYRRTKE